MDVLHLATFLSGLYTLIKGADIITDHASQMAKKLGISELVIGITLVAISTSLPELAVSILSVVTRVGGIATGTIIGSNIANIGLIIGLSALISPLLNRKSFLKEGYYMLIFTLGVSIFLIDGMVFYEGIIILLGLVLYNYVLLKNEAQLANTRENKINNKKAHHLIMCVFGALLVFVGAHLVVHSTLKIAEMLGISEIVVALVAVAIGTSLPELATSFVAAIKKMRGISLGNIIGSNIFNIGILGFASLFDKVPVDYTVVTLDIPVMVIITMLFLIFMRTDWKISRVEALTLLIIYTIFVLVHFI